MSKKMEGGGKMSRREFLVGAGSGALASGAPLPNDAEAGVLHKLFGIGPDSEKLAELTDPYYAARKYMEHRGGKIKANFEKFKAIGASMKNDRMYLDLPQDKRDDEISKLTNPIVYEKNNFLREFDPELITDVLVEAIEAGLAPSEQPLIKIFERAGGKPDHVRKRGRVGLTSADIAAIANISSVMTYRIETNPTPNYGKVYHSPLTFISHEAPRDH